MKLHWAKQALRESDGFYELAVCNLRARHPRITLHEAHALVNQACKEVR